MAQLHKKFQTPKFSQRSFATQKKKLDEILLDLHFLLKLSITETFRNTKESPYEIRFNMPFKMGSAELELFSVCFF